jgi:hypothetical protein
MRRHLACLLGLVLLCGPPGLAEPTQVYKVVNKDGSISFSDRPSDAATAVDIGTVNTAKSLELPEPEAAPRPGEGSTTIQNRVTAYEVSILSPINGQEIGSSQRDVAVSLDIYPWLEPGHTVEIYWNGQPYSDPVRADRIVLENVSRRTAPQLRAVIKDADSNTLAVSQPVTIHIKPRFLPVKPQARVQPIAVQPR